MRSLIKKLQRGVYALSPIFILLFVSAMALNGNYKGDALRENPDSAEFLQPHPENTKQKAPETVVLYFLPVDQMKFF